MQIYITDEAVDWLIEEMDLEAGDQVRFFPKYGGDSAFQQGFSVVWVRKRHRHRKQSLKRKRSLFKWMKKMLGFSTEMI